MKTPIKWNIDLVRGYVEENGNGDELVSKEYNGVKNKLIFKCHLCDKNFDMTWDSYHNGGQRCPKCMIKINAKNRTFSYDYVKEYIESFNCELLSENYERNSKPLKIRLTCGHIDERSFEEFRLYNKVCSNCSKTGKFTYQYVKEYIESKGCELLSKEYINNGLLLKIKCACGNKFETNFVNFKKQNKITCDQCTKNKMRNEKRFSDEEVAQFLIEKEYILLDNCYVNCSKKINIENIITKYKYFVTLSQAKNLDVESFAPNNPHREYNFNIWIKDNNKNFSLENFSTDHGSTRINLKCDSCEKSWNVSLSNIIAGQGCPYCANKRSSEENNLLVKFPEICFDWDFDKNEISPFELLPSSNKKVWWKCHVCKNEWFTTINSRTGKTKTGCPKCASSKGEKILKDYLDYNNIEYMTQYKFKDCKNIRPLPFDFSIFYNNKLVMVIEYDGELHYRPYHKMKNSYEKLIYRQNNDAIKTKYCEDNNIKLLRIPYWDKNKISEILDREFLFLREEV
jgi:hypothetical protein